MPPGNKDILSYRGWTEILKILYYFTKLAELARFKPAFLGNIHLGLPGGAVVKKKSACQYRRHKRLGFSTWVGTIPWSRKWQPTPVLLLGKFYGERSLAGYSSWGRKEVDTTEYTHTIPREHSFVQVTEMSSCHFTLEGDVFAQASFATQTPYTSDSSLKNE